MTGARTPPPRYAVFIALALVLAVLIGARQHRPDDAPFSPRDDAEVLERVAPGTGADPAADALRALEAELARAPSDLALACRVARGHIDAARASGDARRLSYAEAALAPFWSLAAPPEPALLLRATIRQSRHEFDEALADLDRLVAAHPNNAQAWLTRSAILVVRARYSDARASCAHLRGLASALILASCEAQIDGLTGHGDAALSRLTPLLAMPGADAAEQSWARSVLGEAMYYSGQHADAERLLRAALAADATDAYSRALLCDLLIDHGRFDEVLALVAADEQNDNLLLRRAIAAKRARAADAGTIAERLRARDVDLRARGDVSHRREEARRLAEVDGDSEAALAIAALNFAAQKEPWDARVLLEAAAAVARSDEHKRDAAIAAAQPALAWVRDSGCAWVPFVRLAAALRIP